MVRILYIFILLLTATACFAQVERGRYTVGGNVDISMSLQGDVRRFNMSINPAFGVFVVKGFAVGGRYQFGVGSVREFNTRDNEYQSVVTFSTAIGPQLKYYYGKKSLKGLVSANVLYLTSTTLRKSRVNGTQGMSANGLLGIAHFFNNNVALESGLYVTLQAVDKQLPITRFGFSMGLFVFLDKKKKE